MSDVEASGLVPAEQVDGDYPGSLASAVYGLCITVAERVPDHSDACRDIADRFSEGKITDFEAISLLKQEVGDEAVLDAVKRVNSVIFYGLNLQKPIVDRPSVVESNKRITAAIEAIRKRAFGDSK